MAWFLNFYKCERCKRIWTDQWSCMCDDECPNCGTSDFSPIESEDISAFTEKNDDGSYSVFYSPHRPDFSLLGTVTHRSIAVLLEKIAFDLAKPQ